MLTGRHIGSTADNGYRLRLADIDRGQGESVGPRMLSAADDVAHHDTRQSAGYGLYLFHPFHLQSGAGKHLGYPLGGKVQLEVIAEPVE